MKKKTSKGKVAAGIAVGLAAAAAAGYYFYGSKNAKHHRKIVTKWAGDMKKEVIRRAKGLKEMTERDFTKIVNAVANTYRGVKKIDTADLERAASELKANWRAVQREIKQASRRTRKTRTP